MTNPVEKFRQTLLSQGLLLESELDALLDELPLEQRPQTPESLGKFLVNKHRLTLFQVQKVLQGKADELRLGQYVIQEEIRRGAMGEVYRARHPRMKRDVALKVILSKLAEDPECVARFHREVHLAARLNHPNIVTAFDADEANGRLFLVMEYIDGADLKTVIHQHGAISLADTIDYITQAAQGLKYAHCRGVIHRDVKPSNLLLSKSGTIKILDVGLAMEESDRNGSDLTLAGGLLGSVNYMSPEQARDARNADARSDIYSLGCTLWYLLSGSFVYEEKTVVNRILAHREHPVPDLESLGEDIPAELRVIFQNMIAKHPDDRYQSMAELLEDLEKLQSKPSPPAVETPQETCETIRGWSLDDTDHIRDSSDKQLIDFSEDPPEECAPEDPTRVIRELAPSDRLQRASLLRKALIAVGGFGLVCLVMLGLHLLGREGLEFQNLRIGSLSWFAEETVPGTDRDVGTAISIDASTDSSSAANDNSKGNSPESTGRDRGQPVRADTPFSPEISRIHQQRWARFLGTEVEQTNSLGIKMTLIPPGTYEMGFNEDDLAKLLRMFPEEIDDSSRRDQKSHPQHTVTLTKPFQISASVVNYSQFQHFLSDSGYQVQAETLLAWEEETANLATEDLKDYPVRHICWNDAVEFCRWLSSKENREYRLPTEAEWEFACRAGSQELFGQLFESNSEPGWKVGARQMKRVGSTEFNAFGLFYPRGNLREFCLDSFASYSDQPLTDPLVDNYGTNYKRVVRGGRASSELYQLRPAYRRSVSTHDKIDNSYGFRIVANQAQTLDGEIDSEQNGLQLGFRK